MSFSYRLCFMFVCTLDAARGPDGCKGGEFFDFMLRRVWQAKSLAAAGEHATLFEAILVNNFSNGFQEFPH